MTQPPIRDLAYPMMGAADPAGQVSADHQLLEYLGDRVHVRRRSPPTEDWVGVVLSGNEPGLDLTKDDEVNMLQLVFLGGLITVTSMLTLVWWVLAGRPGFRHQIAKGSEFVPALVEQLLRVNSNSSFWRDVLRDVEFAGVQMTKGEIVMRGLMAAMHEGAEFVRPEEIDLHRQTDHVAFVAGAHHCRVAGLARMEMRLALEEFHRRKPDYEISTGADLQWSSGQMYYLTTLPRRRDTVLDGEAN